MGLWAYDVTATLTVVLFLVPYGSCLDHWTLNIEQAKLPGVIQWAMLFLAVVFILFACLGYLAFGEDIGVRNKEAKRVLVVL